MLANFAVALAIVAAAAEATEWGGDFGAYGSKDQLHSRSSAHSSYHPRSSRYGSHSSHGASSYSPKSTGYGSHSTGYSHGAPSSGHGLDSGDFAHGITSWAKKNTSTAGAQYGGQGQNPGYPTRGSYHSERAAPVRHYDDEEAYPEHSYNFNPRPVAHKPEATHAPAQHHGYSAPASSYGSYGHAAPAKSSYGSYGHAAPVSTYSHAAPSHAHYTPAAATPNPNAVSYDGSWWTPNQQYSPPLVKYAVAAGIPHKGLFAKCPIVVVDGMSGAADGDLTGDILFSQLPHQTIKASASLVQVGASTADQVIEFTILTNGDIKTDDTSDNCVVTEGNDEFNPLAEIKNGVTNPYADPKRGRISSAIASALQTDDVTVDQNDLLLNLAGHDSILGRAVIVTAIDVTDPAAPVETDIGCCVIARTNDPADAPADTSIWLRPRVVATAHNHGYNSYPSQSHSNYGGYGGYHH